MPICSPFKTSATRKFKKIGTEGEGFVYMLHTGGLSPIENPSEDQEREKQLADLQWIIIEAVKRVSRELKVTPAKAREILFKADVKDANADEEGTTEVDYSGTNADDYLTREEMDTLQSMRQTKSDMAKLSTTKFMQHRMAYAIELAADAPSMSDSFQLSIKPTFFDAPGESAFLVSGGRLVLAKPIRIGDVTANFKPVTQHPDGKLKKGEPIFLASASTGVEKVGCTEWTADMTNEVPYNLLFAIRDFFEKEAASLSDEDDNADVDEMPAIEAQEDEDLGNSSSESKQQKRKRSSIGSGSTSDSNTSDAATAA